MPRSPPMQQPSRQSSSLRVVLRWAVGLVLLVGSEAFSTTAQRRVHASAPSGDEGVAQLVSNLGSLIEVFNKEQTTGKTLSKSRGTQCKADDKEYESLLVRGQSDANEAEEDLETIAAEAGGLQDEIKASKDSIKAMGEEIDELVQRLAALRANEKQRKEDAVKSLQQIRAVISQTSFRQRAARLQEARIGSLRRGEESYLKELGDRLVSDGARSSSPPAFLQVVAPNTGEVSSKPVVTAALVSQEKRQLQMDGKELQEAVDDEDTKFDQQEKELIELIRTKREELVKLEDTLRGQQPALADKLKQAAETNRTLLAALRGLERDGSMRNASKEKCQVMDTTSAEDTKMRSRLVDSLKVASTLLEHMDTTAFIGKDMRELRGTSPSFLQASSRNLQSPSSSVKLPRGLSLSKRTVPRSPALSLLQAASVAADSGSAAVGSNPFDSVTQMIEELISSLRSQANGDVDQHQFCEESKVKNRQARHLAENSIDEKTTEIHWAKTSIERLDDEIKFLEGEAARLKKAIQAAKSEAKVEEKRFKEETEHRAKADDVINGAVSVLTDLCELQGNGGGADSRNTQCGKVVEELRSAIQLLGQFAQASTTNMEKLRSLLSSHTESRNDETRNAQNDLLAAKRARGRRGDELAAAKTSLEAARKDLSLIEKAKKDLEQNCGPHQETHEERKARREQEIEALKNALNVLEGETTSVDSSSS